MWRQRADGLRDQDVELAEGEEFFNLNDMEIK
jgi:hypothetical protein